LRDVDLEVARAGKQAWKLAGLDSVRPLVTTFTVGANDPAKWRRMRNYAGGSVEVNDGER
jgi:hypothetical protein